LAEIIPKEPGQVMLPREIMKLEINALFSMNNKLSIE
jgi:hypothetical protein